MSIALTTHKVAAAAVGVAMVFSFAFVTPAQAQTVEELTAQINSLLATIAGLQAQLSGLAGGTTGGTTGGTCYNFTQNHSMGDSGGQVMWIQKYMNANGFTVSASGAGSPGQESEFFGSKTKAAVMAWQNANAAAVLAPVGLSAGTGFWGPSSRAHANASCTPGTPGTPGTPTVPTGTGVSVSAAAQPANGLAPAAATRVPFTKFTVTNNSGTAQTINNVTVKRTGLANNGSFDGVVLLDQDGTQLGNERVINSNDTATVGSAVTLQPGESRTFTIAANMKNATTLASFAGEVATFSVVSVNTSATVAGSLPIVGAAHTINATLSIGSLTTIRGPEDPGADNSKEIGETGFEFTALKFTAGSAENVRLWSVRFDQSGSASTSDLANVMAWVDGVSYPVTVDGDYYTVSFPGGILINEGLSKEVVISGDIVGGTNRTVAFDVRKHTDIYATGETYGYGVKADDGNTTTEGTEGTYDDESTPAYNAYDVTILAGSFNSVSKSNSAPAANIAILKPEEILGAFTVDLKGEGITVQTVKINITETGAGADEADLTNVTLVDQNGVVLAGPVDGSTTTELTFSNVEFAPGVTTVFVKGQVGSDFTSGDTIVLSTNPNTDWSDAEGLSTGDSVTLPSSTATANTMTVRAATLTANTSTSEPATRSIVPGATDYVFAVATLDAANSGEDVKVTAVIVEDNVAGGGAAADVNDILNVEIWANLTGGSTKDSVRGDRFETRVADAEQFAATAVNTDATLSITLDTHITVPKDNSIDIAVVADLSSSASTTGTNTHSLFLDTVAGGVTAVGKTSGQSVTVTPAGTGQAQTVAGAGTLTTSVDASSPDAALILDDTVNEQTVAVFRAAATNVEDLDVDSIKISSGNTGVQKYVFYHGATKLGEKTNVGSPELFLADGTLTVPANSHVLITVKAVMNDIDGTTVTNNSNVAVVLDEIQTTGKSSGSAVDDTTDRTAATHQLYEGYPMFAFDNTGVSTVLGPNANYLAAKVTITNSGDEDVTFDASSLIQFNVEISGTLSSATNALTLKDDDGNQLDQVDLGATSGSTSGEIVFADNTLTIPGGGSETVSVFVNTSGLTADGNTLQVWLSDDNDDNVQFDIDADSGDYNEGILIFKGDIFGPVHVNPS